MDERLRTAGCLPYEDVEEELGSALLTKICAVSLLDINVVCNDAGEHRFLTRPAAFSKYGNAFIEDALDLAKAFVSSLTYGMIRSHPGRGRIRMIELILEKLISGRWTGAATAIGQDYRALEYRRVVELRPGKEYGHEMRLLKREVGEMALAVLRSGDTSDQSVPSIPGFAVTNYVGPEMSRTFTRKTQTKSSKIATRDILTALRTGGI